MCYVYWGVSGNVKLIDLAWWVWFKIAGMNWILTVFIEGSNVLTMPRY